MRTSWQLKEATNNFQKIVEGANQFGPQVITECGTAVAIVLSHVEYRRIVASQQKLSDFFRQSPLAEVELKFERDEREILDKFDL